MILPGLAAKSEPEEVSTDTVAPEVVVIAATAAAATPATTTPSTSAVKQSKIIDYFRPGSKAGEPVTPAPEEPGTNISA